MPGSFGVSSHAFGVLAQGDLVTEYVLSHPRGIRASVIDYGGILTSLLVPDGRGVAEDIVLGYERLADYESDAFFMGAVIGRYANRIGHGRFTLDGREFALPQNNGGNHLHGGPNGFHKVLWRASPVEEADKVAVVLTRRSPDGEEGYPGALDVTVEYALHRNGDLSVEYQAVGDQVTIVNMTQHAYFNLAPSRERTILDHELTIHAGRFTPVDASLLPTGEMRNVGGTPFDFRSGRRIGDRVDGADPQLRIGGGYDHNYVLDGPLATGPSPRVPGGLTLREAARLMSPASGRELRVLTTEPGVQFYSGQSLAVRDGVRPRVAGANGLDAFAKYAALCLETQHYPDSPNRSEFPSTRLPAGDTYRSMTVLRFGNVADATGAKGEAFPFRG
ncbi:MAG TPA: aldose epimerase family protein [Polyangiaceae bacterium]|nr:aldose epimerase family protein [Polyangiaceae bacterium]